MKKEAKIGDNFTTTDYLAGGPAFRKHYVNGALSFLQHSEGRALYNAGAFDYEYHLKDHLGNVRVSVNEGDTVVQKDDYYPFGLTFNSYTDTSPANQYTYNSKEEQKEWGVIDYGARMYQADLGRWFNVDPLADNYYSLSPYNYVAKNPLKFVDPDGKEIIVAENSSAVITNLAKIAATSKGNSALNSSNSYTAQTVFWTRNSGYDGLGEAGKARTIRYAPNPWYPGIKSGKVTGTYLLAHELNHADRHERTGHAGIGNFSERQSTEGEAVRFTNYIRSVHGETHMRTGYDKFKLSFPGEPSYYNHENEKVSNFERLFESSVGDEKAMGFSYDKSVNGEQSKTFYQIGIVNESGKYLYAIYDNEDDYNAAVKRIEDYKKKKETTNEE